MGRKTPKEIFTGTRPDGVTFAYSAVSAIVMFMLTIGRSWTLFERRGYLLVTTRFQRNIEFTFLLTGGSL